MHFKILNSREKRDIFKILEAQFSFQGELPYVFLQNREDKIFLITHDLERVALETLRVNNIGLYFCKREKDGIRLSIEGSQLIGEKAKKNVLEVSKEEMIFWLKGEDLPCKENYEGYVVLKHGKDFLGCGKYKEGKILNFVTKSRRILAKEHERELLE